MTYLEVVSEFCFSPGCQVHLLYMSLFNADLNPSLNAIDYLLITIVSNICLQLMQMCPYWRPIFFTDPWTVLEGRKRLLIWHVWSSKKKEQSTNIALGIHRASQGVLSLIIQNACLLSADFPKTLMNNSGPLFGSTLERRKELQSLRVGCFSSFLSTISFNSHSSINSKYSCNVF